MNVDKPDIDPIDVFLSQSTEETNERLRLAIQQKTVAVMRRRRWQRRGGWLAYLAACYAAGILTMWIWPRPEAIHQEAIAPEQNAADQANAVQPLAELKNPAFGQATESARDLEWKALDSRKKRPDLFRLAGDMYLQENDLVSAVRCYRGALEGASDQDLKISVNDNWLLTSLKQAKQEEKRYAKLIRP